MVDVFFFFFQAEDGIRDPLVTGVQTCALPISTVAVPVKLVVGVKTTLVSTIEATPFVGSTLTMLKASPSGSLSLVSTAMVTGTFLEVLAESLSATGGWLVTLMVMSGVGAPVAVGDGVTDGGCPDEVGGRGEEHVGADDGSDAIRRI